jgi:hypothetical protein
MSDEMGRTTRKSKRIPGLGERVKRPESKHVNWVAAIANRFGVRSAGHGFAKAKLTDLTINERIRPGHGTATIASHYDQRQWIQNEFKTVVIQQLVSMAIVAKNAGKPLPPALSKRLERLCAMPGETRHGLAMPSFVRQVSRSGSMAGNTAQQSLDLPLTVAGTRVKRRVGTNVAGIGDAAESIRIEMPVARLVKRHQRVEVASERLAREFGPQPSIQSPESPADEMQRSISRARSHVLEPAEVQEPSRTRAAPHGGINVTQVADEVMKQLDRRLIAARERMGRI